MTSLFHAIHHTAIICSDYERSKVFYTELLGGVVLAETWRAKRQSWKLDIAIAGGQIELFSFPDAPPRPSWPEACGLRHLAFAVNNIEECRHYLMQHNIAVQPIRLDELTGKRFCFFEDPDGLPLEAYEA